MSATIVSWTRRLLATAWMAAFVVCLVVALVARIGDAVVIRGGSMEPALPRGSLVMLEQVAAQGLSAGDIVTVRADNGVLITHRVRRVVELADGAYLELRGDANTTSDPTLAPASAVVGTVSWSAPYFGYLVGLLSTPLGLITVLCALGTGILAIWFLEDVESARRRAAVLA